MYLGRWFGCVPNAAAGPDRSGARDAALNTVAFAGLERVVTGNRAGQLELFSAADGSELLRRAELSGMRLSGTQLAPVR